MRYSGLALIGVCVCLATLRGPRGSVATDSPKKAAAVSEVQDDTHRIAARPTLAHDSRLSSQVGLPQSGDPLVPPIALSEDSRATNDPGVVVLDLLHTNRRASLFPTEFSADDRATFEPHGSQECASGCALSRHPTPELTAAEYSRLLSQFAHEPLGETSTALETLLFYGRQTRLFLQERGAAPLDQSRAEFLRRELARTHARVSFRLTDEAGVIRSHIPPTQVPLDRRHVFQMEVADLSPLVTSGTVKRVGVHHLWTRL